MWDNIMDRIERDNENSSTGVDITFNRDQLLREKGISPEKAATSDDKRLKQIKLTKTNFKHIATVAREFEDYIQDLRGMDSDNARLTRVRDDHWGSDSPNTVKDYAQIGRGKVIKSRERSRPSPTTISSGAQSPEQSRIRPVHDEFGGRVEGHKPEVVHSESSDDESSDDV
ncbi:hypothetical protein LA080_000732 [Diaporthe eres]|nr:hypothetical protein LA080_000732 [Diaporthe eres]